jgi:hypothetical protein
MDETAATPAGRRIKWQNVSTVLSAAILIGAEVFGAAFAGGWALANLLSLGDYGEYVLTASLHRRRGHHGRLHPQSDAIEPFSPRMTWRAALGARESDQTVARISKSSFNRACARHQHNRTFAAKNFDSAAK